MRSEKQSYKRYFAQADEPDKNRPRHLESYVAGSGNSPNSNAAVAKESNSDSVELYIQLLFVRKDR
jgi:hypothetical protein